MTELTLQLDDETAARVTEFAESINVTPEVAASRLLRVAAEVRRILHSKGMLEGGVVGEFLVVSERLPDGSGSWDFRKVDRSEASARDRPRGG